MAILSFYLEDLRVNLLVWGKMDCGGGFLRGIDSTVEIPLICPGFSGLGACWPVDGPGDPDPPSLNYSATFKLMKFLSQQCRHSSDFDALV